MSNEIGASVIASGVGKVGLCSKNLGGCKCCCEDKILVGENYVIVDGVSTSHVGPTMHIIPYCGCSSEKRLISKIKKTEQSQGQNDHTKSSSDRNDKSVAPSAHAVVGEEPPPSCRPETCLNGGRCVPDAHHQPKCICPTHTYGSRCKILHREFNSSRMPRHGSTLGSWAWLPSLPTCSYLHLTLHILTKNLHGLLLYTSDSTVSSYNRFLALQIANGRPQLILRHGKAGKISTITLNSTVHDHKWHRLDLVWKNQVTNFEI